MRNILGHGVSSDTDDPWCRQRIGAEAHPGAAPQLDGCGEWAAIEILGAVDTGGRTVEVAAYGMSHIMDPLEETDLRLMRAAFPEAPTGGIEAVEGKVDLLMGQDNFRLFPIEQRSVEDAALYRSRFGTGWIASGVPPGTKGPRPGSGTVVSAGMAVSAETTSCAGVIGAGLTDRKEEAVAAGAAGNAGLSGSSEGPDGGADRASQLISSNRAAPPVHRWPKRSARTCHAGAKTV